MQGLGNVTVQGISQDPTTGNIILGESPGTQIPKEFFDLEMEKPNI